MRGREFKGTILCKVNFRVFGLFIIKGLVPSLVLQSVTERPTNKPSFTSLTRSTFQGLRCDGCGSTVPPQGSRNYLWLFSSIFFFYILRLIIITVKAVVAMEIKLPKPPAPHFLELLNGRERRAPAICRATSLYQSCTIVLY